MLKINNLKISNGHQANSIPNVISKCYRIFYFCTSFCYTRFKLLTLFYQSATGHLGNKYKSYRVSQAANVNIRSGEATSFKASIKDRVKTTWTEVKTKVGDVKVQAGEAFDNFKNRVSNVKNKTVAAGAEALPIKFGTSMMRWKQVDKMFKI